MKKILVVLVLAAFVVGCGLIPKPPDIEGIEKLLTKDMEDILTVQPEDLGVTIKLEGMPDEFPEGLNGISIYVSSSDMTDLPASELGTPLASKITADITFDTFNLVNGDEYYYEVRGEIAGDTISEMGFGGRFYPRPWGAGSYLGYDPETDTTDWTKNGMTFDRITGIPTEEVANESVDFYFLMQDGELYITSASVLGGTETNWIEPAESHIQNWLDVQDAPDSYSELVKLENQQVYHFMTADSFYGKFAVEQMDMPALLADGDAITVWLRYAFQTKKHTGHY